MDKSKNESILASNKKIVEGILELNKGKKLSKKDILKKLENFPDDAEVRISPDWANDFDYMPIKVIGYIKDFNMIIIEPKYANKEEFA